MKPGQSKRVKGVEEGSIEINCPTCKHYLCHIDMHIRDGYGSFRTMCHHCSCLWLIKFKDVGYYDIEKIS